MASSFTIRPVQSRSDKKRFVDFQYTLYRDYPHWIPSLRQDVCHALSRKKNAFFEHGNMQLFLAEDASKQVIGRIAGIVNGMHLNKYDDGNGFFGFFESVDDEAVTFALLDAACQWLRDQGLTGIRGPTNPSLNDITGLLVGSFDREPSILMPYNPPYYESFLLNYGFERAMTMWAYYVHKKIVNTTKLKRGVNIVMRRNPGLKLRSIDMKHFFDDARAILHVYNDAWSENWGHVPMMEAEFTQLAKAMKQVIDPQLVHLVEDNGRPVAFSVSLPNMNQILKHLPNGRLFPTGLVKLLVYAKFGRIYECRTILMGVIKEYQGRGLDVILNLATIDNGIAAGYDASEMSWVLDSNGVLKNALDAIGGIVDKEYAMFEKRF